MTPYSIREFKDLNDGFEPVPINKEGILPPLGESTPPKQQPPPQEGEEGPGMSGEGDSDESDDSNEGLGGDPSAGSNDKDTSSGESEDEKEQPGFDKESSNDNPDEPEDGSDSKKEQTPGSDGEPSEEDPLDKSLKNDKKDENKNIEGDESNDDAEGGDGIENTKNPGPDSNDRDKGFEGNGGSGSGSGETNPDGWDPNRKVEDSDSNLSIEGGGIADEQEFNEDIKPADPKDSKNLREEVLDESEISNIVKKAIDEMSQGRGTGESHITNLIAKHYATKTDWRPILKRFLLKGEKQTIEDRSYNRPSKTSHVLNRFMPSDTQQEGGVPQRTIAIAIDTSGSVFDPKFMDRFFSEVFMVVKKLNYNVLMIMWTEQVYYTALVTPKNVKAELAKAKLQTGGTYMSSVYDWLMMPNNTKIRKKLAGVVYITDLAVEVDPKMLSGVPVAIFGPQELLARNVSMINYMKKKGYTVASYS